MAEQVRIWTSPTCPHCKRAKEYLSRKNIDFVNFDVTSDQEAYNEMKELTNGGRSVPVIEVCGKVLVGFDPDKFDEAADCLG